MAADNEIAIGAAVALSCRRSSGAAGGELPQSLGADATALAAVLRVQVIRDDCANDKSDDRARTPARSGPAVGLDDLIERQLRKAIKTKGSFPDDDAARELIYLAVQNATPQWTRTRNWTTALLAFKIHFGDRLPDSAS